MANGMGRLSRYHWVDGKKDKGKNAMNRQEGAMIWLITLLCCLLAAVPPMGWATDATPLTKSNLVQGWVSFQDKPVSQAILAIYAFDGKMIYQGQSPGTDESGYFKIEVDNLPASFRIVAGKGIYEKEPFLVDLSAEYWQFDPKMDIAYINDATTTGNIHFDSYPNTTALYEAGSPETPDWVCSDKTNSKAYKVYFDYDKFQTIATAYRGANKYSDRLIADIYTLLVTDTGTGTPLAPVVDQTSLKTARAGDWIKMKSVTAIDGESMEQIIHVAVVSRDETALTTRTVISCQDIEIVNSVDETLLAAVGYMDQIISQEIAAGLSIRDLGNGYETLQLAGRTVQAFWESYEIQEKTEAGHDTTVLTVWTSPQIPLFNLVKMTVTVTIKGTRVMTSSAEVTDFGLGN